MVKHTLDLGQEGYHRIDFRMQNLHKCQRCKLCFIESEKHYCPLEVATQLGYHFINGKWYIVWVLTGDIYTGQSKTIKPIPIPSYLKRPTRNQHDIKHGDNLTEPRILKNGNGSSK